MTGGASGVGLVVGASGVTGTPTVEELAAAGWKVYGVSRRAPRLREDFGARFQHLAFDLTDAAATRRALAACGDITHVFYCANDGAPATRLAMMANAIDAIEAAASGFANINLLQGTKYYGSYLGPFKTPAKETDPRIAAGDFYYEEEDLVAGRQRGKRWTWTAVRPTAVCGYAANNPLNLAVVLAVYGTLLRELKQPFGFPGSPACFHALHQAIDAELLARSAIWVSTQPGCGNRAYNVGNGDIFRWEHLWPALARWFGLEPAGPQPYSLARFLADNAAAWETISRRHGLRPFPYERASAWAQGSFAPPNSRLACEYDFITDLMRLRRSGFHEVLETERMYLRLFDRYRKEEVIP
ncbi:MAG: SDR family oxidoreductase [Burkholderiales bacterium]|nr:SDR family oxidoreductase [Burkholderiales bacterium]